MSTRKTNIQKGYLEIRIFTEDGKPSDVDQGVHTLQMHKLSVTLATMIEQVAKYEFVAKPAAGIGLINAGIPKKHQDFWSRLSAKGIKKAV